MLKHTQKICEQIGFFKTSARIWSFPVTYFPAFGLNTEIYVVNLGIQSECGKKRTRHFRIWTPFTECLTQLVTVFCLIHSLKFMLIYVNMISPSGVIAIFRGVSRTHSSTCKGKKFVKYFCYLNSIIGAWQRYKYEFCI